MKSVSMRPAAGGELDAAALRHAEVGALADHPGVDLGCRHPQGIVGAIAHLLVPLGRGPHIGADAAEPEQVRPALENGAHQLGRGNARRIETEQRLHLVAEGDRFGRAREHAAALGNLGLVVVLPARARQIEQAPALGEAAGTRVRIDEDVAMIEGRDELDVLRQQHAVAEHVARHVADADHAEGLRLDVDVHLAEMALHAFPGAARRDRHALVVVADGAAGGEGIAQPEVARRRELVGDVGERRRALVGGDHQVGIVAVVAHHALGRHDLAVLQVVGDVEQSGDEDAVGGNAFRLHLVAACPSAAAAWAGSRPWRRRARSRRS